MVHVILALMLNDMCTSSNHLDEFMTDSWSGAFNLVLSR